MTRPTIDGWTNPYDLADAAESVLKRLGSIGVDAVAKELDTELTVLLAVHGLHRDLRNEWKPMSPVMESTLRRQCGGNFYGTLYDAIKQAALTTQETTELNAIFDAYSNRITDEA